MGKTVRVGFVGTGGIATELHMKQLVEVPGVEFAAMTDARPERAKAAADQYGGKVFADHYELLEKAEIDALYICLPPSAHTDAEIIAAGKGIHLYVEKPIVLTMEKGLEIWEAVKKANIITSVGYQLRYSPNVQWVKQFLADKQVGMVAGNRWGGIAGDENHWWRVMSISGGMFHEQATHGMDFIRYVVGDVASVCARYSLTVLKGTPNLDIPDSQVVVLEFKSGATGYYASNCSLTKGGGWSAHDFILKDMLVRHTWGGITVTPEGAATVELPEAGPNADAAFIEAVRTGDRSLILTDYLDGLKTCEVTLGANESARTGRGVEMKL
jgi:predicted dehydrogenase